MTNAYVQDYLSLDSLVNFNLDPQLYKAYNSSRDL